MKRDLALIREILLKAEQEDFRNKEFVLENEDINIVNEHLYLLKQAGFIDANVDFISNNNINKVVFYRITWEGYEFLDTIRNENIFKKAIDKLAPIQSFAIPLLKELCLAILKESIVK